MSGWLPLLRDLVVFLVAAGAFTWLGMLIFSVLYGDRLLFPAPASSYTSLPGEVQMQDSNGSTVTGLWLPLPGATQTILYSHGNAEDLGVIGDWLQLFADAGFNVFAYDYPGYGTSDGEPTSESVNASADLAWQWLVESQGIDPQDIFLYGRSLGGGPALALANRHPVGGVIVESTFVSAFRVMTRYPILPWDRFNNLNEVCQLEVPLLVIHGTADQVVPIWHAHKLRDRAKVEPKSFLWVGGAGHNNILDGYREVITQTIRDFVDDVNAARPPEEPAVSRVLPPGDPAAT